MREPEAVIAGPDGRPALSLSEAARAAGVSRSTIRRRHESGAFTTAFKDADGVWRIPHEDLLVGVRSAPLLTAQAHAQGYPAQDRTDELERRAQDLEQQLRAAEHRYRLAEAIADEREKALADARLALRALTAGPSAVSVPDAIDQASEPVAGPLTALPEPVRASARRRRSFREWWSGADLPA